MIDSEEKLENYICENQEQFIQELKKIFHIRENIDFVGRQVRIGEHNIADLIYSFEKITKSEKYDFEEKTINFIIVELKYRKLQPKDLGQLGRYIVTLEDKIINDNKTEKKYDCFEIYGVLAGFDLDEDLQEIQMLLDRNNDTIKFINVEHSTQYSGVSYSHNTDYIKDLKLDVRLEKLFK